MTLRGLLGAAHAGGLGFAAQQAGHAQVVIQQRPMDARAAAAQFPTGALLRLRRRECRKKCQGRPNSRPSASLTCNCPSAIAIVLILVSEEFIPAFQHHGVLLPNSIQGSGHEPRGSSMFSCGRRQVFEKEPPHPASRNAKRCQTSAGELQRSGNPRSTIEQVPAATAATEPAVKAA